jgi:hypothetical protein
LQIAARRRDRQVAVAESAHQVKRLARRLLVRETRRVVCHRALHRRSHVWCRAEEAVCRHQPLDPLVRPLKVVCLHVERESPRAVRKVREDRPRQKFVPERLPKPLHFAERLRVLGPRLHVSDALPAELLLEFRLAAPRRVLPPLVRQDLARRAVVRDAARQRFHDQRRPLVVRERVRHEIPRVVVHEGRHVHALVAPQQKGEDVRLPQLVRLGALEAPRRVLPLRRRRRTLGEQPLLVQDAPDRRLADAETLEALEHVAQAARPVLRVLGAQRHDRRARLRVPRDTSRRRRPRRLRHQRVHPTGLVQRLPLPDRVRMDPEHASDLAAAPSALGQLPHHAKPKLHGVAVSGAWVSLLAVFV